MYNKKERQLTQDYPSIFYILLLLLLKIALINSSNTSNFRIINSYDSEIHLVIKKNGNINLLYDDFQFEPSEVIINGIRNYSCSKTCYLSDNINIITLKFPNQIDSTEKMFKNLDYISEIDLSNFDSTLVTSMSEMFLGCSQLISVILPNYNS